MNDDKNQSGYDEETFGVTSESSDELDITDVAPNMEMQVSSDEDVDEEKEENTVDGKEIYTSGWDAGYTIPDEGSSAIQKEEESGRALEICALIFGILSIIACCCYGIFGLIGVILSIVALVKGKRSGMTIVGLICSVLGLVLSVAIILVLRSDYFSEVRDAYDQYNAERDYALQSEEVDIEDLEEYLNPTDNTKNNANVIPSEAAGVVMIEGNEFSIPCKVSDFLEVYEVSEYSKADMEGELETGDTTSIFLATDGVQNGIGILIENVTEETLMNIEDATVYSINVVSDGEYAISDVKVFNGISFGMTSAEVKLALDGVEYEENVMDYGEESYTFYSIDAGDTGEYTIVIMLKDDVVISVDILMY